MLAMTKMDATATPNILHVFNASDTFRGLRIDTLQASSKMDRSGRGILGWREKSIFPARPLDSPVICPMLVQLQAAAGAVHVARPTDFDLTPHGGS
jgi:hypothetical protein